ncbi:MAG: hypothetical protein M1820_002685 [Bogoriella megaspora]|nr:MAG: hypothetical protein M1820_002685 [Bogoriella megaspora]
MPPAKSSNPNGASAPPPAVASHSNNRQANFPIHRPKSNGMSDNAHNPTNSKEALNKVGDYMTELLQKIKNDFPTLSLRGELNLDIGTSSNGAFTIALDNSPKAASNVRINRRRAGPPDTGASQPQQQPTPQSLAPSVPNPGSTSATSQLGKHPRDSEVIVIPDEPIEKRVRTSPEPTTSHSPPPPLPEDLLQDDAPAALQAMLEYQRRRIEEHDTAGTDKLRKLMTEWREQWREQGAWMYDFFKRARDDEVAKKAWMEFMFKDMETRLGSAMQSYHVTSSSDSAVKHGQTLSEFGMLKKDISWLDERRQAADAAHSQREETWRSSSATFHDTTHKNREASEKWMIQEMKAQRAATTTLTTMMLDVCKELKGNDYVSPHMSTVTPAATRAPSLGSQLINAAERSNTTPAIDLTGSSQRSRKPSEAQTESSGLTEAQTASEGT